MTKDKKYVATAKSEYELLISPKNDGVLMQAIGAINFKILFSELNRPETIYTVPTERIRLTITLAPIKLNANANKLPTDSTPYG
jgi:hypothetical protein